MADYVFEGKSIHVDINLVDGTDFDEVFTYLDSNDQTVNLTGETAVLQIRNVDSKDVVHSATDADPDITLGGSAGTIRLLITSALLPTLLLPCYEWDLKLGSGFRFARGYIYRNMLL